MVIDEEAPIGSPGTHYTAPVVKAYDPTGLRSAMTATHEETYKSIQSHMPQHNVKLDWEARTDEILAKTVGRGLPPVPGLNDSGVPDEAKKAAW